MINDLAAERIGTVASGDRMQRSPTPRKAREIAPDRVRDGAARVVVARWGVRKRRRGGAPVDYTAATAGAGSQ